MIPSKEEIRKALDTPYEIEDVAKILDLEIEQIAEHIANRLIPVIDVNGRLMVPAEYIKILIKSISQIHEKNLEQQADRSQEGRNP